MGPSRTRTNWFIASRIQNVCDRCLSGMFSDTSSAGMKPLKMRRLCRKQIGSMSKVAGVLRLWWRPCLLRMHFFIGARNRPTPIAFG